MKKLLLILSIVASSLGLFGQETKYVAPDGQGDNGNDGSSGSPWATLTYAATQVSSGDSIYVQTGTHTQTARVDIPVGVSLIGGGNTSIIHSTVSTNFTTTIRFYSASEGVNGNQVVKDLRFTGNGTDTWSAIEVVGRSNVRIYDCEFEDFFKMGVSFSGQTPVGGTSAPTTYATGNEFYDNTMNNCSDFEGTSGNGYGCIQFGGQDGILIYNNTITNNERAQYRNGYTLKFCSGGYSKGFKIYNNTLTGAEDGDAGTYFSFAIELWHTQGGAQIYDNTCVGGIDFGGAYTFICLEKGDYDYGAWVYDNTFGPSTYVSGMTGIYLERNTEGAIIEKNHFKNFYNAIRMTPTSGETCEDHRISYNLFDSIGYYGIRYQYGENNNATTDNLEIYNNVFWMRPSGSLVGIGLSTAGTTKNIYVRNNIIYNASYGGILGDGNNGQTLDSLYIQNNYLYNCGNSNQPRFDNLTPTNYTASNNAEGVDPELVNPPTNMQPQADAPIINNGFTTGLTTDYLGNVVPYPEDGSSDIGAYEYGSSPPIPVPYTPKVTTINGYYWGRNKKYWILKEL